MTRGAGFSARFAIAGGLAIGGLAFAACSSATQPECDCIDPSLKISVAPESAAAVLDVRLSGEACGSAKVTCAQEGIGGCASWRFAATAAGTCHIDVDFVSGTTYARDISIVQTTGCCSGFFPSPASAGEIDVTVPPGGVTDAGGQDAAPPEDAGASDGASSDVSAPDASGAGASDARSDV